MRGRLAATAVIVSLFAAAAVAQPVPLRSGDLVLTRNSDAIGNPNGYFNHVGIVFEHGHGFAVAEMQQEFDGCIAVTAKAFFRRYPEYMIIRHENSELAARAGKHASAYIGGLRYGLAGSLKPFVQWGQKDNCVSLTRKCYRDAGLADPRWIKPDGIYRFGGVSGFRAVAHFRYIDYVPPQNFYEGRFFP